MQQKNITLLTVLFLSGCISASAMENFSLTNIGDSCLNNAEFYVLERDYLNQPIQIASPLLYEYPSITINRNLIYFNVVDNKSVGNVKFYWVSINPDEENNHHNGSLSSEKWPTGLFRSRQSKKYTRRNDESKRTIRKV